MIRVAGPPACPGCGEPLTDVRETVHEFYSWHDGGYDEDEDLGALDVECGKCGASLSDEPGFEDGACNFALDDGAAGEGGEGE